LLAFLGQAMTDEGQVVEGKNFAARSSGLWSRMNHNWMRITRILRSLSLLGLSAQAQAFFQQLKSLHDSGKFPITADTLWYWTDAVKGI